MKKLSKQAEGQQAYSEAAYYAQLYLLSLAEPEKKLSQMEGQESMGGLIEWE